MSPLLIMALAGGGLLLAAKTRKRRSKAPVVVAPPDPGEPGKRDPTKKLPSAQPVQPKPVPKPQPPPPTPDPKVPVEPEPQWGNLEYLEDWGEDYLVGQPREDGKWRIGYMPVAFVWWFSDVGGDPPISWYQGQLFDSPNDAIWWAANHGPSKVEYRILAKGKDETGTEFVFYFDHGYGIKIDAVADPLSPTGVSKRWVVWSKDVDPTSGPLAQGTAPTEQQALQAIEEVIS